MAQFETLYQKVLADHHFRHELRTNPHAALVSIGIEPTPEVLTLLKNLEVALTAIAQDLDGTAETVPLMT
jgi:hypothetical protein